MLITPDPATPEGAAVIDLAALMDALQARTGEWPGAETTAILSDWLRRFSFAAPTAHTTQRAGQAWVLRRWDRSCEEVTLWSDEASALASLAQHVRTHWDNVAGTDGVPHRPPADDRTAVDAYYGPEDERCDEDYTLRAYDVLRHGDTARPLSLADARACAEANCVAVFHPMQGPDDEGLPCLDTADEQLLQADGSVPAQVDVEDTTVFAQPPVPPEPTGWRALLRRLVGRTAKPEGGERRQGG
ncbi:hypothetical protein [Streptomyces geysiriensis]|uniref:hypothetical protein n=2 Tax=Streptomyces rochei group TaxID=2867164 RepID=UPI001C7D74E3|nr:hypothetical protein [Streptomyces geysiriensis]MBX4175664.1 hypothetical protein [Streptomyces geysiriensis]